MERDLRTREPRVVVATPEEHAGVAADAIAAVLGVCAETPGCISVALAGGSTPRPIYRELPGMEGLTWDRVAFWFGDERAVEPDDPESNHRMARAALLDRIGVHRGQIHRMEAEREDGDVAAEQYALSLPDPLDVLLLGIGSDGHMASLFPGSPALQEERRRVVFVKAPAEPKRRMTLTPPVIRSAVFRIVLARGREKADAVVRALEGPLDPMTCPARLARSGTWILDSDAASRLESTPRSFGEPGVERRRDVNDGTAKKRGKG